MSDSFSTKTSLTAGGKTVAMYRLAALKGAEAKVARLPISLRILLENLLRKEDGRVVKKSDIEALLDWNPKAEPDREISFYPSRVLMQDFTGVPAVVDLAAMREAIVKLGGKPERINPLEPADLVIDHSVMVDHFGTKNAFDLNAKLEMDRNRERYELLRWGQQAFQGFRVVPPDVGICHQVNLEYLASSVMEKNGVAYPDSVVGTDSHTTMINGLGVLGWGVGGIEAEAALLGQPISMLIPQVIGFRLHGQLKSGCTATDLVLTVTQMLRKKGVVGKFVEFFGSGISTLPLTDRATIANMAPEYGATMGFFPVDAETVSYLRFTGRPAAQCELVEAYYKAQGMYHTPDMADPTFTDVLELDLATVEPSLAGPKRPQDRVALTQVKATFRKNVVEMGEKSANPPTVDEKLKVKAAVTDSSRGSAQSFELSNGAVVIAAITSCTNTSNPSVMMAAGLLAKKAVDKGLSVRPWVKTSLAPGSKVVTRYLEAAGVMPALEQLGYNLVGYGCTTCIGNSGPLSDAISDAIPKHDLVVASVLSGNRNFEGRVHPLARMNFLASPPLVVAYALCGTVDIDLDKEPVGQGKDGPVFLKDIWPSPSEVETALRSAVKPEQYSSEYATAFDGDASWKKLEVPKGNTFRWDEKSTYVRNPPYFEGISKTPAPVTDVVGARCLLVLGDSVTTDHISPAGNISKKSPAAKYLAEHGVPVEDFNSYGARRGNHEVMMRGTFANIRLRNSMVTLEGGYAVHFAKGGFAAGEVESIYDVAMKYQAENVPLVVLAGAEYGTGSSRDWAAKGTRLLGVRAVIAKSFERIHRSNLVGMGVLPLEFKNGEDAASLKLTGKEIFSIGGIAAGVKPGQDLVVDAKAEDGSTRSFQVRLRIDTPNEVDYYKHGGILQYVLRQLAGVA
jgi:aconitate hydratase